MEPPLELHHVLAGERSERVHCVRAYRLHLVFQIETSIPETKDVLAYQQSFRIAINRNGVLRVE